MTVKLLKSKRGWKGVYDKVVIISPTFPLQPIWGQISPAGVNVHLAFTTEIIEDLMKQQTENRDRKVLLLLDDLGEDVHHSKEAKPVFHKLVANSRHLNISLVWLCQRNTQAPTFVRSNTDCYISFASLSARERSTLQRSVYD